MANELDTVPKIFAVEELAMSAGNLSDICAEKREVLKSQAISRSKWQKRLHIASGVIALLSGGAITAVVTDLTSSLQMKIFATTLAFSSGIISLVTTTLFDTKETQRMFEGAAQFLIIRDKLRALHHRRSTLTPDQFDEALGPLRTEYNKTSADFDPLLAS